jgi:hypothetical protein
MKTLLALALLALTTSFSALADHPHPRPMGMHTACAEDMKKFCGDVKYGDHDGMMNCMKTHKDKLSAACNTEHTQMKAKMDEIKAACQGDIDKFCGDKKGDPHAMRECMRSSKDKFSEGCKAAHVKMAKEMMQGHH